MNIRKNSCSLIYVAFLAIILANGPLKAAANDLFPYKNAEDPIFIVVTGQSNALQVFTSRVPMEPNPLVWDWVREEISDTTTDSEVVETPGSEELPATEETPSTEENATLYVWRQPDPDAPFTEHFDSTAIFTGYPGNQRGGVAWGLANKLAELTGRQVYMVCTAQAGQDISQWKPGEGAIALELNYQVGNAMAALQGDYPGIQFADVVVWVQGESDAHLGTTPEEYAEQWFAWRDHVEGENNPLPWSHNQNTKWYLTQMSQEISYQVAWQGHDHILQLAGERTRMISSVGKETADTLHFWGDEATEFGEEVADDMFEPNADSEDEPPIPAGC